MAKKRRKAHAGGGGEIPTPFSESLASFSRKIEEPIRHEIARVEGYLGQLRGMLSGLTGRTNTTPNHNKTKANATTGMKKKRKPRGTSNKALAVKGSEIIAFLKKRPGHWIGSAELAVHAGIPKVAQAIKAAGVEGHIERRGPGRKSEYRIKA
jgi:hypothetical protein